MDGLDCLGVEDAKDKKSGFDYGALLQAAGGVASYSIAAAEKDKAEKKSAEDEKKKLEAVIAADIAAANAMARAAVSSQLKQSSAAVDAMSAQTAQQAQDRAGMGLTSDVAEKRAEAAEKQLATATKNAQSAPNDGYKAALVASWTATVNKAHNSSIVSSGDFGKGDKGKGKHGKDGDKESWFTRRVVGPIPGAGVLAIGVGVVGVLGFAVKKIFWR